MATIRADDLVAVWPPGLEITDEAFSLVHTEWIRNGKNLLSPEEVLTLMRRHLPGPNRGDNGHP